MHVHPSVFHNVMDTLPVDGWQVVQGVDGLHILLVGMSGAIDDGQLERLVQQVVASL